MNTHPNCSALKGHLVMVATIVPVVSVLTLLDIQISLARIDSGDATTTIHLARPEAAYSFIPLLAAVIALVAIVVNSVLGLLLRRHLSRAVHWGMLGAAFALISVAQPLSAIGINEPLVLWLSAATAVLSAIGVRWRYGVSRAHVLGTPT